MDNQATSHLHPQKSTVTKVSTMVLIQVSPWKLLLEGLFKWSLPQRCCGSTFAQNMSEKSSNSTWSKVPELHNSGREQLQKETEPQNPNDDATLPKVKSKTCFFVLWPSCHDQSHPIGLQIYNAETANANYGGCSSMLLTNSDIRLQCVAKVYE